MNQAINAFHAQQLADDMKLQANFDACREQYDTAAEVEAAMIALGHTSHDVAYCYERIFMI